MNELLIPKLDPALMRKLEQSAKKSGRCLPDEAKAILSHALAKQDLERPLGTALVEYFRSAHSD